jgi:hypothetical protein
MSEVETLNFVRNSGLLWFELMTCEIRSLTQHSTNSPRTRNVSRRLFRWLHQDVRDHQGQGGETFRSRKRTPTVSLLMLRVGDLRWIRSSHLRLVLEQVLGRRRADPD